jgi:hypothetical protein
MNMVELIRQWIIEHGMDMSQTSGYVMPTTPSVRQRHEALG